MSFLTGIAGKAMIALVLITACLFFSWRISKLWLHHDPLPVRHGPYQVKEITSGASIRIGAGRRGRRDRDVLLTGVAAPADGQPLAAESRESLADFAGGQVWIEREGAIIRERRIEGVVYGESGEHLQVAQLRAGMVRTTPIGDAIKAYRQAQAEAVKAKRGIWALPPQWIEVVCDECGGTGCLPARNCPICGGSGKTPAGRNCGICDGTGRVPEGECFMCGGSGKLYEEPRE